MSKQDDDDYDHEKALDKIIKDGDKAKREEERQKGLQDERHKRRN